VREIYTVALVFGGIRKGECTERNAALLAVVNAAFKVGDFVARARPADVLLSHALLAVCKRSKAIIIKTAAFAHIHKIQLIGTSFLHIR